MQITSEDQNFNERLRVLESRYNLVRERLLLINQTMVTEYKKILEDMKETNLEIKNMKKDLFEIKEAINNIIRELNLFAKREQVHTIEKYINLWNPLNFTTEKDVIRMIKEKGDKNTK